MLNTLYLPELREMLAAGDADELREFCTALHPARTAEFMAGLDPAEAWQVLQHADPPLRESIFGYFEYEQQIAIIEQHDREEIADLIAVMSPDDRVDLLDNVDDEIVDELLELVPDDERRDILRLRAYPEGTAGAVMTTEVAMLPEALTVRQALDELARQAEHLETIYYLYVVDETGHLRGVASVRQLVSALKHPEMPLKELVETEVLVAEVHEDQESVAQKVARYDLLAIPVVDAEHRMLGIITHDDVIDVVREEATEDAHRIAAVDPLQDSYLRTSILTLGWKRGMWLTILFFAALLTTFALRHYEKSIERWEWLVWFIPLVISSGGNTGSQSSTLIITGLATGDIRLGNWLTVVRRELLMGLLLGAFLGSIGYLATLVLKWQDAAAEETLLSVAVAATVVPVTLILVVVCGTLSGSILPLLFRRLGLDPAMMSSPFVTGIIDILGIVIYMNVAMWVLS